jgi:hypothetical protein
MSEKENHLPASTYVELEAVSHAIDGDFPMLLLIDIENVAEFCFKMLRHIGAQTVANAGLKRT